MRSGLTATQASRARLRAAGGTELLVRLPRDVVSFLDEFKERQGLRSRSEVLLRLIEHGRVTTAQQ
ncbi:MAG: hypothetical protein P4L40_17460 [Terracidiphilus sp.]|nr:hypothetical protein [Terracidiphilus sp.]